MKKPLAMFSLFLLGCTTQAGTVETIAVSEEEISAPTCAPSLANGAVAAKQRAMLDTIAWTEGTADSCGQDGYNTGFGNNCFTTCFKHPNTLWSGDGDSSSAAGRYQFLSTTWSGLALGNFGPQNQDLGAMTLIARRGVTLPSDRALSATEFANAMKKLSYEWASLPSSPYGQPAKTLGATRSKYCSKAGC